MLKTLNLGAGNRIVKGAVNHDRRKHRAEIDVCWDLSVLPWPWADEQFDAVEAWAVLEHLDIDLLTAMDEIWRLLTEGGTANVKLPYWQSEGAYSDPTHRYAVGLGVFDIFDPTTKRGQDYFFYSPRKWRILQRTLVNDPPTSVACKLAKVKLWRT